MNTNMLVFVAYFLDYVLLFWDDNLDEEYKSFSNCKKVQPQGVGYRGGSRTAATSKMERFVIIVNGLSR